MKVTEEGQPTWKLVGFLVGVLSIGMLASLISSTGARGAASDLEHAVNGPDGLEAQLTEIQTTQSILKLAFQQIIDNQDAGRERGFINRSVSCQAVVVDNDRTWGIPLECLDPDITKYYPVDLCVILGLPAPCGEAAGVNTQVG